MMVAGGGASVANAVDVQNEFLDRYYYYGEVKIDCSDIDDFPSDNPDFEVLQDICHNLEKLKNCQIASAVS